MTSEKNRVLEAMDDGGYWDDEEDEDDTEFEDDIFDAIEDEDDEFDDDEEGAVETESCSVDDLLFSCFEDMMTIGKKKEAEEKAEEVLFDSFISAVNI